MPCPPAKEGVAYSALPTYRRGCGLQCPAHLQKGAWLTVSYPPAEGGVTFVCFSASWLLFLLDLYSWFSWHDRKCKVTEVNCHQGAGSELGLQGKLSSPSVLYTEMEVGLAPPCSAQLTPGSLPCRLSLHSCSRHHRPG